jgi:hypothetical protein
MHSTLALLAVVGLSLGTMTAGYAQDVTPVTVMYPAGWNLVSGPTATTFTEAVGPLYSLQPGEADYGMTPTVTRLPAGNGWWAYFAAPVAKTFTRGNLEPITETVLAQQFSMVGNPFLTPAVVRGADAVFTYSPERGYEQAASIPVGQGAFVYSTTGGTVTITTAP